MLKTLESIIIRGAEGHLQRESSYQGRPTELQSYISSGALIGIQVNRTDFVLNLLDSVMVGVSHSRFSMLF